MRVIYPTKAFLDAFYSLSNEYANTGDANTVIVLGSHLFVEQFESINAFKKAYNINHMIVYNLEQLSNHCKWLTNKYTYLLKHADEVWDYDEANIEFLNNNNIRNNVNLHLLSPRSKHFVGCNIDYHPIDVFFYGSLNARRKKIIDELKSHKLNVEIGNGLYGDELTPMLCMSKVLLNIHYYPEALQEQARLIRWMCMPNKIISERSRVNYLHINECNYDDIVERVLSMVKSIR